MTAGLLFLVWAGGIEGAGRAGWSFWRRFFWPYDAGRLLAEFIVEVEKARR